MLRLVLLFLTLCALSEPARADWQYTRWGMTPEEVVKASNGSAQPVSSEKIRDKSIPHGDALLEGPYESKDFAFSVTYLFRSKQLTAVKLRLTRVDDSLKLRVQLREVYGPPSKEVNNSKKTQNCTENSASWRAVSDRNDVSYLELECNFSAIGKHSHISQIIYSRVSTGRDTGL